MKFSARNVANPIISSLTKFGTYVLQDAITDTDGTTNCPVQLGVIHADNSGIIDFAKEEPAFGAKLTKIIGPAARVGVSPWPWDDDRQQYALDFHMDTTRIPGGVYYGYWKVPQTGLITVTGGSATVTGAGTSFQTGVCNGGSTPRGGGFIWWRDGAGHYTERGVASCGSNASLMLSQVYPKNADTGGGLAHCDTPCSGLTFGWGWDGDGATEGYSSAWRFGPSPANYYDSVAAFYAYYYRSGLSDYKTAARSLADDWFNSPLIDRGYGCDVNAEWKNCVQRRSLSITGVMLRALDGNSAMFTGLRAAIWPFCKFFVIRNSLNGEIDDIREQAYMQACVADAAIAETDSTERSKLQAILSSTAVTQWQTFQQPNGGFLMWYSSGGSRGNATTLTMTNGSTSATVNGGTCPTSAGQVDNIWYLWAWTTSPNTRPSSPAGGDAAYYYATCNNTSSVTLNKPYEGTTGNKGWSYGQPFTGWGVQPYMSAILGIAFEQSAIALDGVANTDRDLYRRMAEDLGKWLINYGRNISDTGMYSGVFSVCHHPIPAGDKMCGTFMQDAVSSRRTLNAEIVRAIGMSYLRSGSPDVKSAADLLMTEMFCKASTNCGFASTADYLASLNDGGFYVAGPFPAGQAKYTGQFFGFPNSESWPALRLQVPPR